MSDEKSSKSNPHTATISWTGPGENFIKGRFSREHTWSFDGGQTVTASPSPYVVPKPWSNPAGVDPEEALLAALSSCHMLTYLWLASKAGFQVDSYTDEVVGEMTKNDAGVPWLSRITLNVRIVYGGQQTPTPEDEDRLHEKAHQQCFIAQSIKADVVVNKVAE